MGIDVTILIGLAALILLLLFLIAYFITSKKDSKNSSEGDRVVVPQRRAQLARNRGIRYRGAQQQQNNELVVDETNTENVVEPTDSKIGAKKRAKLEAKAEKKAQREVEEQLRKEKKQKDILLDEEKKKIEEKERENLKKLEEDEKKAQEEKERKEYEEYLKMKEAFSVEEEGYEDDQDNEQSLLKEFVDFIKEQKVVIIEDLAAKFKLKTQSVIERLKDLQEDNILTGVIDDRGKFIYVSPEEMKMVVKFIRQRGRVSISELVENSNVLIHMNPITST